MIRDDILYQVDIFTPNMKVCDFYPRAYVGGGCLPRSEAVPVVRPQSHGVGGCFPQSLQVFRASARGGTVMQRKDEVSAYGLPEWLPCGPGRPVTYRMLLFRV